ncbi:S-layer homology domain-containing protein [Desulfoscipio sp. XC116]|uniref:S-layer homology domain-containing protein n=1 Tax=Desulfoscipio sp. XC116 TaxID=3144975 RepID=UPI00325AE516
MCRVLRKKPITLVLTMVILCGLVLGLGFSLGMGTVYAGGSPSGSGTADDPYQITGVADLNWIRDNFPTVKDKYFVQTVDIDLGGVSNFSPLDDPDDWDGFTGTYDGAWHTISNMKVTSAVNNYYAGFFICIGETGAVRNIKFSDVDINISPTRTEYMGTIAALNYGTLENCYVTSGNIIGGNSTGVGGLVSDNGGTITSCYNAAHVSVGIYDARMTTVGGIAASNSGFIRNCWNSGNMTSADDQAVAAGITATTNANSVSNCYSTGTVLTAVKGGGIAGTAFSGNLFSNFYLTGTSTNGIGMLDNGAASNSQAEPEDDTQMRTASTFSGWDSSDTWSIINGQYPALLTTANTPVAVSALGGDALATIRWNKAKRAGGYRIYWRTAEGSYNETDYADALGYEATSTTINNLADDTTYYFVVKAICDEAVPSSASNEVSATTNAPPYAGARTAEALASTLTPSVGDTTEITLTVKDSLGNTDTGFGGAINVTLTGASAAPDNSYGSFNGTTLDVTSAVSGQSIPVVFTNGTATADLVLNGATAQTIGFSVAGVATPEANTLAITPTAGPAVSMSLTTGITAPAANGGQFAQQPEITLKDAYGNTCTGDNSTQVTASKKDSGNWTLTGTVTAAADNGIVTFTDLGAGNTARVDNAQLAFNATGLSQITSSPVVLSPPGLSIITGSLPYGTVGECYSATLTASGGTAPYTWTITGLPAELGYNSVQGAVYGTPVDTGEYSVSAAVYDSGSQNASKNFILTIDNVPAVHVIGIALNKNSLTLTAGGRSETLTYMITPANATNQSVTWYSSNPSVATAVYGVVTPVAVGIAEVTATTIDGGFTDTCFVTVNTQSSGGDDNDDNDDNESSGNNSSNDNNSTPNNISINGREQQGIGTTTVTTTGNGQTVTTVTVDQRRIEQTLEAEGSNAVVTISANADSDITIGELNGQTVKSMEQKQAVLNVSTGEASYTLPAAQINIDAVSEQVGRQVELKDIKVTVKISKTPNETVRVIENDAERGGYTIIAPPVSFDITCTYGDKTIQVDRFNSYVERTIAIPEGVDPQKITTGVIVNPDGTVNHVPTQIVVINGKYYAKMNSLTNSTYSVIWNPVVFSDAINHWAEEPVNEMGSRKVIGGIGDNRFAPDREITRAEFASITMRALGLVENDNKSAFKDVKDSDWFAGAVSIANEYGLISGYTDGTFRPNNKITREEAMSIISKAMNLAGMDTDTTDTETQLASFNDRDKVGGWAKDAVASCIKSNIVKGSNQMLSPKENITRAETAAIVMRLLQEAGLI